MSRNREEAIAAGVKVEEARHNMKRRKPWHDYHRKGTYMLNWWLMAGCLYWGD